MAIAERGADPRETRAVRERYARFAREEAPGRSERYADWSRGVAGDPAMCALLSAIPANRRQPPLVFAVTRMLGAPPGDYADWARFVGAHAEQVVAECSRRLLQTNEPGRCAALLVALERIPGPVALLEVGASAGLCLYPDRYSYRYLSAAQAPLDPAAGPSPVVLPCELRGGIAAPARLPRVAWRAGIDLHPLDARDPADRAWLTGLVWPGEDGRAERMEAALEIAADEPPTLMAGDAGDTALLSWLAAAAPQDAALVITTPGVTPHLPAATRARLAEGIAAAGARWITLDAPADETASGFDLLLDGERIALADPLGGWIAPSRPS